MNDKLEKPMCAPSTNVKILTSPWIETFYKLATQAERSLLIVSPFISKKPLAKVSDLVREKNHDFKLEVVTNLSLENILSGSLDIEALSQLSNSNPNSIITYLPRLHAKVYIADSSVAVITSGNLTNNGLVNNFEYGILIDEKCLVSQIGDDISQYALLGSKVSSETLSLLETSVQALKQTKQEIDRNAKAQLRKALEQQTELVKLELLKTQARGKTTHKIFCDTIFFVLGKHDRLTTVQMHPMIQEIHPDLCDDNVDRLIEGVHFGKKWKHFVRMAQQGLKRKGVINFDGNFWFRK